MKRRHWMVTTVVVVMLLASALPVSAAGIGTRAYGMGSAFTAIADDLSALYWNPAGVGKTSFELAVELGGPDLTGAGQFGKIMDDPQSWTGDAALNLTTLAGISLGPIAIGGFAEGDINIVKSGTDVDAAGKYRADLVLAGARTLTKGPLNVGTTRVGVSVKRLSGQKVDYQVTGAATETREDWNGQGYGLDAGLLLELSPIVTLGVVAKDLFAGLAWTGTRKTTDLVAQTSTTATLPEEKQSLPAWYRGGIAIDPPLLDGILTADIDSQGRFSYGLEKHFFFHGLTLRLGQIQATGDTLTTAGVGFNLGPIHVSAAAGSADGFKNMDASLDGSIRF